MCAVFFTHPACLEHDPTVFSPGHPDTPERLVALERALAQQDWLGYTRLSAPAAADEQLELAHSPRHVRAIRSLCARGGGSVDPDTFVVEASFEAARRAAGAGCALVAALLSGEADAGFCAVRPAGHHAELERAMGFCLFNNVAVAAASAIAEHGRTRVFVLDWDVHHGNGTAEIFRDRRDVLFASIHQSPLYPGTGPLEDCGSSAGEGYTINLPVPPGSGEPLWMALFEQVVLPAARTYEPELILVSAGFDAHAQDPLANCRLSTGSFVELARRTRSLADELGVGLGVMLEGGYNPGILAECACATLPALAAGREPPARAERMQGEPLLRDGHPQGEPLPAPPSEGEQALLRRALEQYRLYWPL
jgi:acetoin utilization deacetylase AcuC-like enzyme